MNRMNQESSLDPTSARLKSIALAVAAVLLLLAASYFFYAPLSNMANEAWAALTFPQELRSAQFLGREEGSSFIYEHAFARFDRTEIGDEYAIVSAARQGESLASIATLPDGSFALLVNAKPVLTSTSRKDTVSLSPGGTAIAFTEKTSNADQMTVGRSAIVLDLATSNLIVLGPGHTPLFIDATHVLWFPPTGPSITDIRTGAVTILSGASAPAPLPAPVLSPDRTLVAWMNAVDSTISVNRITSEGPEQLASFPITSTNPQISLGNDALYMLTPTDAGTEIWRHSFDGAPAVKIYRFKPSLTVSQLIL